MRYALSTETLLAVLRARLGSGLLTGGHRRFPVWVVEAQKVCVIFHVCKLSSTPPATRGRQT